MVYEAADNKSERRANRKAKREICVSEIDQEEIDEETMEYKHDLLYPDPRDDPNFYKFAQVTKNKFFRKPKKFRLTHANDV